MATQLTNVTGVLHSIFFCKSCDIRFGAHLYIRFQFCFFFLLCCTHVKYYYFGRSREKKVDSERRNENFVFIWRMQEFIEFIRSLFSFSHSYFIHSTLYRRGHGNRLTLVWVRVCCVAALGRLVIVAIVVDSMYDYYYYYFILPWTGFTLWNSIGADCVIKYSGDIARRYSADAPLYVPHCVSVYEWDKCQGKFCIKWKLIAVQRRWRIALTMPRKWNFLKLYYEYIYSQYIYYIFIRFRQRQLLLVFIRLLLLLFTHYFYMKIERVEVVIMIAGN